MPFKEHWKKISESNSLKKLPRESHWDFLSLDFIYEFRYLPQASPFHGYKEEV